MGSFPTPPPLPAPPQLNAPGPFQGYNNPNQPASPYPPSVGANLLQGISSFVEQYQKQRESERERNAHLAQQSIQNMLIGLPVDLKKTAAYMKKAGMNIDFETPVAQPAQTVSQAIPGGNGIPEMITGTTFPPGPNGATPQASAAPASFWDRIKQAAGFSQPQINPQSTGMQSLQQLAEMGRGNLASQQRQQELEAGKQNIEGQQQAVIQAALQGNPAAQEMWAMIENKGQRIPMDQIFKIGRQAGLDDSKIAQAVLSKELGLGVNVEQQMKLAESYSKYFGNDLGAAHKYVTDIMTQGYSDLKPDGMSIDDRLKIAQRVNDLQKQYPTAPLNIVRSMAMSEVSGNAEYANRIGGMLDKFPTQEELRHEEWSQGFNLDLRKFGEQMNEFKQTHELAVVQAVRSAMGDQFDQGMKIMDRKGATDGEKEAGARMIADAAAKLKGIKIDGVDISNNLTTTRIRHWNSLINGDLELTSTDPNQVEQALLQGLTPPPGVSPGSDEYKAWIEKAQKYATGLLMSKTPDSRALGQGNEPKRLSTDKPLPGLPPMTPGTGYGALGPVTEGQQ